MRDDFPPPPAFKMPANAEDPAQPPGAAGFGLVQPPEPIRAWRIVAAGAVGAGFLGMMLAIAAPKGFPGAPDTRPAARPQTVATADLPNFRPIGGKYAPPDRERIAAAYRDVARVSASDGVGAVARASMDCFQKLARQADYGLMDYCLALDAFGAESYVRAAGEAAPPSTYFGQGPVRRQHAVQRLTAGQTDANSRLLDTNRLIQEVALSGADVAPPPPPPPPLAPSGTVQIAAAEPAPAPVAQPTGPVAAKLLAPTPLAPMPPVAPAPPAPRVVQVAKVEHRPAVAPVQATAVSTKPAAAPVAQPKPPAKPAKPAGAAIAAAPVKPLSPAKLVQAKAAEPKGRTVKSTAAARPVVLASTKAAKTTKPAPVPELRNAKLAKAAKRPPVPSKVAASNTVTVRAELKPGRSIVELRASMARLASKAPPPRVAAKPPAAPVQVAKAKPAPAISAPAPIEVRAKPIVVAEKQPAPGGAGGPKPPPPPWRAPRRLGARRPRNRPSSRPSARSPPSRPAAAAPAASAWSARSRPSPPPTSASRPPSVRPSIRRRTPEPWSPSKTAGLRAGTRWPPTPGPSWPPTRTASLS
jgi:hypothetical protein